MPDHHDPTDDYTRLAALTRLAEQARASGDVQAELNLLELLADRARAYRRAAKKRAAALNPQTF
jgi:hypothetical protein